MRVQFALLFALQINCPTNEKYHAINSCPGEAVDLTATPVSCCLANNLAFKFIICCLSLNNETLHTYSYAYNVQW